eukprot:m.50768 g.50768  ORF g.50768 m.50768 type:complete len:365 (-) comp7532_c0_seq1:967-2061(-)
MGTRKNNAIASHPLSTCNLVRISFIAVGLIVWSHLPLPLASGIPWTVTYDAICPSSEMNPDNDVSCGLASPASTHCIMPKKGEYGPVALGDRLMNEGYFWQSTREVVLNGDESRRLARVAGRCIVSEEYKFVFHHVLKSGGSTVNNMLRLALGGVVPNHRPGQAIPAKLATYGFGRLKLDGCKKYGKDYFHFSFVRDPFDRARSIYAYAQQLRDSNKEFKPRKSMPSLYQFLRAGNPCWCLKGATPLTLIHTTPQLTLLTDTEKADDDTLTVDLLCNLKKLNHCMLEHITPTLRSKVRAQALSEQRERVMLEKVDLLDQYFRTQSETSNQSKKRTFSSEEMQRFKCLVYNGPYAQDYSAFFSTM